MHRREERPAPPHLVGRVQARPHRLCARVPRRGPGQGRPADHPLPQDLALGLAADGRHAVARRHRRDRRRLRRRRRARARVRLRRRRAPHGARVHALVVPLAPEPAHATPTAARWRTACASRCASSSACASASATTSPSASASSARSASATATRRRRRANRRRPRARRRRLRLALGRRQVRGRARHRRRAALSVHRLLRRSLHAGQHYPDGANLYIPEAVRAALRAAGLETPVVAAGKIGTLALAEKVLARGQGDLVGMARALLADPDLPEEVAGGRRGHGRPLRLRQRLQGARRELPSRRLHALAEEARAGARERGHRSARVAAKGAGLRASTRKGQVLLRWQAATDNQAIYGYQVLRADARDGSVLRPPRERPRRHRRATRTRASSAARRTATRSVPTTSPATAGR